MAPTQPSAADRPMRSWRGLSGRVLVISISLVLVVQMALVCSLVVGRWHDVLSERLASALVAALVQEAAGPNMVDKALQAELLRVSGVGTIALRREDFRQLVLTDTSRAAIDARVDLRTDGFLSCVMKAFATLMRGGEGRMQVIGPIQKMPGEFIEIVLPDREVYAALKDVLLQGVVSAFAFAAFIGVALFWVLRRALVKPVQRLTGSMIRFAEDPEDPANTLTAWNRYDEIGTAAKQLRDLQLRLRNLLGEKQRLASLGSAVARINHDLRNLFATMQLVSDTLERVDDPRVQRAAPRLVRALERGIKLCESTLEYGRSGDIDTTLSRQRLMPVLDEVIDQFQASDLKVSIKTFVPEGTQASIDADHLFRILSNLLRNALAAIKTPSGSIDIACKETESGLSLQITDSGPGIPTNVQSTLFSAFGASGTRGGSGLGLAISRELARAMGGDITLVSTGPTGTVFAIHLLA